MKLTDRLLAAFTEWFCSRGGVWQTTAVTLAVVVFEASDRHLDPHGFWLLYILTIYSAVTQPALAYSGASSAARLESLEAQNCALLAQIEELIAGQAQIHKAVKAGVTVPATTSKEGEP